MAVIVLPVFDMATMLYPFVSDAASNECFLVQNMLMFHFCPPWYFNICRAAEKGNFEAAVKLGIAYLYNEGRKFFNLRWMLWCSHTPARTVFKLLSVLFLNTHSIFKRRGQGWCLRKEGISLLQFGREPEASVRRPFHLGLHPAAVVPLGQLLQSGSVRAPPRWIWH